MTESRQTYAPGAALDGVQRAALGAAVIGVAGLAAGFASDPEQFYRSYLVAYIYWIAVALGSLVLMMIHHLSGGAWGLMIRRPLEAGASTIPVMGVLFLPILLGMHSLYEWSHADRVSTDEIIAHRAPYLNASFFTIRFLIYFVVWTGLAWTLIRWSRQQDREPPAPGADAKFRIVSGPGVLIYGLSVSFASFDWLMSLDPHWYSTLFGLMFMVGHGLTALAFTIFIMSVLTKHEPIAHVVQDKNIHDLGKLLLAFVMLWAYLGYSQFLITWAANLPEEIPYYLRRFNHGWQWVSVVLVAAHFALPFLLLLSRDRKKRANRLVRVAFLVLLMRFIDYYWLVIPQFRTESIAPHWIDVAAWVGMGGVFVSLYVRQLKSHSLLPVNDPYLHEALADGH